MANDEKKKKLGVDPAGSTTPNIGSFIESIGGPENLTKFTPETPTAITPDELTAPIKPIEPIQPPEVFAFPVVDIPDVPPLAPTPTETEATEVSKRLRELTQETVGEAAFRGEEEERRGITVLEQTQQDLSGQLKILQAEAKAIPIRLQQEAEGRGITKGGLAPIQAGQLRENAIKALTVSSLLEASRGNLSLAYDQVDRAVAQKFDPIREEIAATRANLQLILESPEFTREQQNKAQARLNAQNAREAEIDAQEALEKEIGGIAIQAAQAGVDALTLRRIQSQTDPVLATQIAQQAGLFAEEVEPNLQFVSGTKTQPAGVFDKDTGTFTPLQVSSDTSGLGDELGVDVEFGSPEYVNSVIQGSSEFDKAMTDSQLEKVQKAMDALGGVESLNSLLFQGDDGVDLTGPVKGRVRGLITKIGGDAEAAAINATIQGLIPTVARGIFGEVGVLTDADINNYKKTLANLTSSEEQNRLVSVIMLDVLSRSLESTLITNALNQKNVSGFAPVYNNVRQRIADEKAKLGITNFSSLDNTSFLDSIPEEDVSSTPQTLNEAGPLDLQTLFNKWFN